MMYANSPMLFVGVTISSTYSDLEKHRDELRRAVNANGLKDVCMENDYAKINDKIESSLQMVADGAAYILIIGHRYGDIPKCKVRNRASLSITELEFEHALRLQRPMLMFVMSRKHPVLIDDVESDHTKKKKLELFKTRAKKYHGTSAVHRIYYEFDDINDFIRAAHASVPALAHHLQQGRLGGSSFRNVQPRQGLIPKPPLFYAEPAYLGSHPFVGRAAQLVLLDDWVRSSDSTAVLLFEAIGGSGKSILTSYWINSDRCSTSRVWAGRMWYSFYERGARLSDFCLHALAYSMERPVEELEQIESSKRLQMLIEVLRSGSWLVVMDGLERLLVEYHHLNAAELEGRVGLLQNTSIRRDPCETIRPEDADFLRALATAGPSKILITSRLTPSCLLNNAAQPLPGVQRSWLPGLEPPDAEQLLRNCGITGDSIHIQSYLTKHCGCHPLTTGVIAGLVANYSPSRFDFDRWSTDPNEGGVLEVGGLDLTWKRNHILSTALKNLTPTSRSLLNGISIFSGSIDRKMLDLINPHLPPKPEVVERPNDPAQDYVRWRKLSDDAQWWEYRAFRKGVKRFESYQKLNEERRMLEGHPDPARKLNTSIRDLEARGLLQYEHETGRYDLHPVVRSVAAQDIQSSGSKMGHSLVDHFSQAAHRPYDQAESIEDLEIGINHIRALLLLNKFQEAANLYMSELAYALMFRLEAYTEALGLVRAFFKTPWNLLVAGLNDSSASFMYNEAANLLTLLDEDNATSSIYLHAIEIDTHHYNWVNASITMSNLSAALANENELTESERLAGIALDLSRLVDNGSGAFRAHLDLAWLLARRGAFSAIRLPESHHLDDKCRLREGDFDYLMAVTEFWQGNLSENRLSVTEVLARKGGNRPVVRQICALRGEWLMAQEKWHEATLVLSEAIRLSRESNQSHALYETLLAIALQKLGRLQNGIAEAFRLSRKRNPAHLALAELFMVLGDHNTAIRHADYAYRWAWAEGPPFARQHELRCAKLLLLKLNVAEPKLSVYQERKPAPQPWEQRIHTAIKTLKGARAR